MIPLITIAAVSLISLTGPDNQSIDLNPHEIVSLRIPRSGDHFAKGTSCLINTTDGKVVAVQEQCYVVRQLIEHN